MQTRKLTSAALLIAIGTLSAHLIYIPAGVSKCFPVQHAINVMGAVLLGPDYAVAIGFIIACLRNMLGTGSLLAFPGSMIGAALAGLAYSRYKTLPAAMAGEIFGTGIIGGFVAWIMATLLLGSKAVAWFFIPPFLVSTIGGSVIACLLLKTGFFKQFSRSDAKPKLPFMKSSGFSGRFTPARLNTKSAFWQYSSSSAGVESRSYS